MSWIKTANKLGRYRTSYRGFRIYQTRIRFIAMNKRFVIFKSQKLEEIGIMIDAHYIIVE